MKRTHSLSLAALIIALGVLSGCNTTKPYQRAILSQTDMSLSAYPIQKADQNFQSYREAASGANGGKVGGGCGCN